MAKQTKYEYQKPNLDQRPGETLEHYYRRLAKQADQRLVRLEKLQQQEGYENVTKWSYARAMEDIRKWSGEGARRFNMKPPATFVDGAPKTKEDRKAILSKIRDMKQFLEAPTSTKSNIQKFFKGRADTINEKYGVNMTWESMGKFFESETWKKLDAKYGSKTVMKAIGKLTKLRDEKDAESDEKGKTGLEEFLQSVQEAEETHVYIADDRQANAVIEDWIAADGLSMDDFFG